ncbi:hypothetical protein IFM89_006856 [Coptis chinensis]|uniref:ARC6 IMS domain-containing protein n=1 Tax=Coptis chinensis TaxID=261450 RepID=A0A835LD11_9MAGN|nr:hypothetical protein IFM89_006856 [Coptis chinensis]
MEGLKHSIGVATLINPHRHHHLKLKPTNASSTSNKWADRLLSDFQFTDPLTPTNPSSPLISILPLPSRHVSLPIDFYQVLGAEPHFLSDGIKRCFDSKISQSPQYGFTQETLLSRRQILQAACETLTNSTTRQDYNQGLVENLITEVPWENVAGALCVLQECGETELVIKVGEKLLREGGGGKWFKQDVVLVMALAYVDLSRDAMALSPPDFIESCQVLECALKLLQEEGATSLAPDLQAQIDETLEEITPRCVLELLALPLDDEHHHRRREEGLRGVRNILWAVGAGGAAAIAGGFTREDFMIEAFARMTAAEQVDLFAATPSNIPPESFEVYGVALALVAKAFVSKKPHHIRDADGLFLQLQQTKVTTLGTVVLDYTTRADLETDYALERGLCSLLVGELDECRTWLGLDNVSSPYRDPDVVEFVMENSKDDDENDFLPGLCKLLETWLLKEVFPKFRDTQNIQFKIGDYYDDPTVLRYLERQEGVGGSPLAVAAAIVRVGAKATAVLDNVKASTILALRKVFPLGNRKESMKSEEDDSKIISFPSVETEEILENIDRDSSGGLAEISGKSSFDDLNDEESVTEKTKDASLMIMSAGVVIALLTFGGLKYITARNWLSGSSKVVPSVASDVVNVDELNVDAEVTPRMDARFAENILEGQMLKIWTDRAVEIAERGWVWEYTLLSLTIDSVTVSLDGKRAMVEATLDEAARLTDIVHPEHNDSYSTIYTTRYEMSFSKSGWRIVEGAVLKS